MIKPDTIPPRKGEELPRQRLQDFLQKEIPDLPEGRLEIRQFPAGLSNLTYALRIGDWEAVLRRPPIGPVAPKAHDMKREYNVLRKISAVFPLAPKPYVYSDDRSVIGSEFFIMERRYGVQVDKGLPEGWALSNDEKRKISRTMVDTLAELHNIDVENKRFAEIGHPEGFMERQVHGWIKRYERAKTEEIPGVRTVQKWLVDHLPAPQKPTLIHYDFKLNNVLFSPEDPSRLVGVFDWEMATIGDPLADLGVTLSYWTEADDPDVLKQGHGKPQITTEPGFYSRDEWVERYARKTRRDVTFIDYYLTFAYFKLAVICQQIYARWKRGQTADVRFCHLDRFVRGLIEHTRFRISNAGG